MRRVTRHLQERMQRLSLPSSASNSMRKSVIAKTTARVPADLSSTQIALGSLQAVPRESDGRSYAHQVSRSVGFKGEIFI